MHNIEVWMVKPLSVVGKHCGYMLSTEFTCLATVYTKLVWPLVSFLSFFSFHLGCNLLLLFSSEGITNKSGSRRVYLPNPDPIVMEKWEKDMGREKSEVKEDEDHV